MVRLFTLLTLLLVTSTSLLAGPWPQPKGKGYFKLSEWWLRFDEHYTTSGELDPNATLGLYNTTFYGEYGATERLTLIANVIPFSRATINDQLSATRPGLIIDAGEAYNGLGDSELGFRYALSRPGSKVALSAGVLLGLPLGNEAAGDGGRLQTGDGEFNQYFNLGAGTSWSLGTSSSLFVSATAGFNNRSQGFSDEFRYSLEAGLGLLQNDLYLIGRLTGAESFFNGETAAANTTSVFSNNAEFTSVGIEANYYVTDRFGLSAGVAGAVSGRIIAAAPAYSVGVFLDTSR